jgi:AcrR family transcriptional regulator
MNETDQRKGSKKVGRRPGQSTTKADITIAARALFARIGYDPTTIRDIADRAGVDPALVMHYFATKQELFIAAMIPPQDMPHQISEQLAGDTATLGLRLATLFVGKLESKMTNQIIVGTLRAAVRVPGAAALLRVVLVRPILNVFKDSQKLDNAELRAGLVQSQMIGLVMTRYILKVQPLASASAEELVAYLAPTLQRYLTGDLSNKREGV